MAAAISGVATVAGKPAHTVTGLVYGTLVLHNPLKNDLDATPGYCETLAGLVALEVG